MDLVVTSFFLTWNALRSFERMSFWRLTVRDAVSSQITVILVPKQGLLILLILLSLCLYCLVKCLKLMQFIPGSYTWSCILSLHVERKSVLQVHGFTWKVLIILRSYWYFFQQHFVKLPFWEIAVLFNVYGPRAGPEDEERIQFKANFFKIMQVCSLISNMNFPFIAVFCFQEHF